MKPQSILVTGGAGFIGSNLIRLLIERGFRVLNLDKLTYAGNLSSLAPVAKHPQYRFERVDLLDAECLEEVLKSFRPDAIMHLAAESHVDRSIDGPKTFVETNVMGTLNILQAARGFWETLPPTQKSNFRFLHVSTDEVYGSLGAVGKFTETTPYCPHSPYSATKAASDHLARAWHDTYGLPVLVTNCSNNYGPFQFPEKLIPVVILKCLRNESIPIYAQGLNVRDWLYVEDHCDALISVVERGRVGETYNIGGDNEIRNLDLVRLLCEIMDELAPRPNGNAYAELITFVADRPGHDMRYAINAEKIKSELGWTPKQGAFSGFRKTVIWYLDNRHWWQDILSGEYRMDRLGTKV